MPQLQEGETITIGKRTGTIAYVNQQLQFYQVNYSKRRAELISFDQVEGCQTMKVQIDSEDMKRLSGKRIDSVIYNNESRKFVLWTSDGIMTMDAPVNRTISAK